jgi:hypothetical protein
MFYVQGRFNWETEVLILVSGEGLLFKIRNEPEGACPQLPAACIMTVLQYSSLCVNRENITF